jgi:magnesium chelatase family protein
MVIKTFSAAYFGLEVFGIEAEIDIVPSLPSIVIVGLADKAVTESKDRIRSALRESGFEFPLGRITVNLAPADINKSGSGFDLAIAVGITIQAGLIKAVKEIDKIIFVGELALDGSIRKVDGVLPICLWARDKGYKTIIIPKENVGEVRLIRGIEIIGVSKLVEVTDYLENKNDLQPIKIANLESIVESHKNEKRYEVDMSNIRGQHLAKRALEIAACGFHNIMLIGEPGSGKTLLARAISGILPSMTENEILEISQIYSVAGLLSKSDLILQRPFRSPHHSASHVAIVGGGSRLTPGEISLAHRGVLFMDEFPEFSRITLEALRQPLEDGVVDISRITGRVRYPARCMLVAAANPSPSGYFINKDDREHTAKTKALKAYQNKFSGPVMDRIDLYVEIIKPKTEELTATTKAESTESIRQRVEKAKEFQNNRLKEFGLNNNSEISAQNIQEVAVLSRDAENLVTKSIDKLKLSGRGYHRLLKVARTIADLDQSSSIEVKHLAEALQFRPRSFVDG